MAQLAKKSASNVGDLGWIPGLGRSLGEGKGALFRYFGLEISMDYIVHRVTKSRTRLSDFHFCFSFHLNFGFSRWYSGKESSCQCRRHRDTSSVPRWGRSGVGNGNPHQYSCLGNSMVKGTLQATVHGVTKELDMTEQLNTHPHTRLYLHQHLR